MSGDGSPEVGIWKIVNDRPERFQLSQIDYENDLEAWIENNPTLLQSNLLIVGRQVRTAAGQLDLLAIDTLGRWAVIELKRGNVRRKTVVQALDYASCIAELSPNELRQLAGECLKSRRTTIETFLSEYSLDADVFDQPAVIVYVIGTGRDHDLERLTKNLSFQGNPVNVVTFKVFENDSGERLIVRSLTETQADVERVDKPTSSARGQKTELERLFAIANSNRIGREFRRIYDVALRHQLYPRIFKWSIMYTPPQNKSRVIICAWVRPKRGMFEVYVNHAAIAEFYPVGEREVKRSLRYVGQCRLTPEDVETFIRDFDQLFRRIHTDL